MFSSGHRHRRLLRRFAVSLPAALLAAGCAGLPWDSSPQTTSAVPGRSPTFRERMQDLFFGPSTAVPQGEVAALTQRDPKEECPSVDIRAGTSTLQLRPPGAEPAATTLRYQVSVARTARECAISGTTMNVKVGVQGRVILGPEGVPGRIDVPLRYALVREGVEPKTIWTQLHRVPIDIPPGQTNVPFMHIEEQLAFPLPSRRELAAYVIYVGFDPQGVVERAGKKTKARRSR